MNKYDTGMARFFANIFDTTLFIPVAILDRFILTEEKPLSLVIIWILISNCLLIAYNLYFHTKNGQTLGKRLMGIVVLDVSEQRYLTLKQAFLRDSIYILFQIGTVFLIIIKLFSIGNYSESSISTYNLNLSYFSLIWLFVEIITMFTNKKRRAFHDFLGTSVVVKFR